MSLPGGAGLPPGLLHDTTLADLDATWLEREEEAALLIGGGFRTIAISLRIYALEIRVKATICRRLNLDFLPKVCKTHDLAELLIFTGLWQVMNDPSNDAVRQNWNLLADFSKKRLNDLRYLPRSVTSDDAADRLIAALDDPKDGVLAWLSRHP